MFFISNAVVTAEHSSALQEYELELDLYGKVDPARSKYELLKTKVEVQLFKTEPIQWPCLEASAQGAPKPATAAAMPPPSSHPPAYPSSFKR